MADDSSLLTTGLAPTPTPYALRRASVVDPLVDVTERHGLELADRLSAIRSWLDAELGGLEDEIDVLERGGRSHPDVSRRAAAHLLEQKGKRIRPVCVALGARVAGAPVDDRVTDLAVAAELVHAATLLHDDVIDEASVRRGAPAARVVFGNSASVLAGDYLLIEALERVQRAHAPLVAGILACISHMVAAEALQLERRGRFTPDRGQYMRIIDGKTASLFRWALEAGAQLPGGDASCAPALGAAGMALGRAFQLIDDVLDFDGDPAHTGKDLFLDIEQGKLTWPLILASEDDPSFGERVAAIATRGSVTDDEAASIATALRKSGALEATRARAESERQRAVDELASLPPSPATVALEAVAAAAVARAR